MEHFPQIRALVLPAFLPANDHGNDDGNDDGNDGDVLPDKVPLAIQWSSIISKRYNSNAKYRDNALLEAFEDNNVRFHFF